MNRIEICCKLLLLISFLSVPGLADEAKHQLIVKVSGAKPNTGQVALSLFSSPENYLKNPLVKKLKPIDNKGQTYFVIDHLASGNYAVSVIYDEDNNGRLNKGFLGIPTELVGFSNNARGTFGPPTFKETSFQLSEKKAIEIVLGKAKE